MIFKNRTDAGKQLAKKLLLYKKQDTIVLGLPRGGVVVAYEVAKLLNVPLEVFVSRKVGAPQNPEFAIGAIAEGGIVQFNEKSIHAFHLSKQVVDQLVFREAEEIRRRIQVYRQDRELNIEGKTVILVDDGLATGLTAEVAIAALRSLHAKEIVLAVPVVSFQSAADISFKVDSLYCILAPINMHLVAAHYHDFKAVTDDEVRNYLQKARLRGKTT